MDVEFLGPPLAEGPLPAVFYFALSAKDSLHLDPFNQPARFLAEHRLRVFSMTLPGHDHLPPEEALSCWPEKLTPFLHEATDEITSLQGSIEAGRCAVMGLSRGVFIACHVAALVSSIKTILGFAPMTRLGSLNLLPLAEPLCDRTIRFYIGNRDTRVGTAHTFELVQALAECAYQKQISSSPIELIIGPSIGRQGHGTSPEVFRAGTNWLLETL